LDESDGSLIDTATDGIFLKTAMKRISLKDIAQQAGVHFTLVAMALRDDPRVRASTKKHILQIAQQLGYQRDAKLSELMAQVRSGTSSSVAREQLAFISTNPSDLASYGVRRSLEGVKNRAAFLGYDVEVFFIEKLKNNFARLGSVLYAQGIKGVLFQPMHASEDLPHFPWEHFACAALCAPLPGIPIHTARHHHFNSMLTAHEKILATGLKRIGFFIWDEGALWTNHEFEAAYAYAQSQLPVKQRIPLLKIKTWPPPDMKETHARLRQWVEKHKIQAVLSVCGLYKEFIKMGYQLPQELSCVELEYREEKENVSGMEQNNDLVGAAGVDLVVGQIHRKERGIPSSPKIVLTEGSWREGKTLLPALK
jgi:LacI family transcriptional regulator